MKTDQYGCTFSFRHVAGDALVAYATPKRLSRTPPGDAPRRPCHVGWNRSLSTQEKRLWPSLGVSRVRDGGREASTLERGCSRGREGERAERGSELRRPRAFICIPLSSVTRCGRGGETQQRRPAGSRGEPPPRGRGSGIRDATKILPSLPKMLNKLGADGGVGRGAAKTSEMGKRIHQAPGKRDAN